MKTKMLMLASDARIDWNRFERLIHDRFNVNAVAYDGNGRRRTSNTLWTNGLCALIKRHPNARQLICDALLRSMIHEARAVRQYVTDECAAGIYRRLFPILQDLELEGFFGVCGRPFSNRKLMYADYVQKATGVQNAVIEDLISTVEPISPRQIREMTEFIIEEGISRCDLHELEADSVH
jgi:hypothetical protein